jgi:hypothetical protein
MHQDWNRSQVGNDGGNVDNVESVSRQAPQQLQAEKCPRIEHTPEPGDTRIGLPLLVGLAAAAFTGVYLISDVIEVVQGNFSTFRLSLTYVGEAAIPLFVVGLYAVQRPQIGRLGLFGAITFAYSYVFFTGTVLYALIAGLPNYHALTKVLGTWMAIHGLVMLMGGLTFGLAVVRARVLPRWTGVCLMVGVVLVVSASGLPIIARTMAEAVPAVAFIGIGCALLGGRSPTLASDRGHPS